MKLTISTLVTIDDEDFDLISNHTWGIQVTNGKAYAYSRINNNYVAMHRLILGLSDEKLHVDHISGNTLDNRKENLRIVTHQQNMWNASKAKINKTGGSCSSQYKGVHWEQGRKRWRAQIMKSGTVYRLGRFKTEEEAALAYNIKAIELFGEYAHINEIF